MSKFGIQCHPPSKHAHYLVKFLHVQCVIEGISREELSRRSGTPASTLKGWWSARRGVSPKLVHIENNLNVFGYTLKPVVKVTP